MLIKPLYSIHIVSVIGLHRYRFITGETSLAHNEALFFDELPEYNKM
jgi:predicted ATPase with chaperone activity